MAAPHRVMRSRKKIQNENYAPNERAYDKADDFHDAQGFRKRTYSGPDRLTREIRTISKNILGTRGFAGVNIIECWDDVVGADLSKGIRPEKLTFDKEMRTNGTLHVKSAGGAFAILFEHQKNHIIERVNTFFGYPAVGRIHIAQGKLYFPQVTKQPLLKKPTPRQLKELRQKVNLIEDESLRQATYRIGLSLLQKKKDDII